MIELFDDAYITRLTKEAERVIAREIRYIYYRFTFAITSGTAVYELPAYVRDIDEITWKGNIVQPLHQKELAEINYNYLSQESGQPYYYLRSPENILGIRFSPIPNEALTASSTDDTSNDTIIGSKMVISCYREPDTSTPLLSLPDYISRRLVKAYVLYKAFAREGEGQQLQASQYYENKYRFLLQSFQRVHERFWATIERLDDPRILQGLEEPTLPPDFTIPKLTLPISAFEAQDSMNNWADDVSVVNA